jgi:glutamyl-Q tRNA(Asp) synthetase
LHFGSLVAAVGSYLQAKSGDANSQWLVRIEDIDTPRTVPGAASEILRTLEQFGLYWDETEVYQSQRLDFYQHHFQQLQANQQIYPCQCSRARISQLGGIYDGFCRQHPLIDPTQPLAWRMKSQQVHNYFDDAVFGRVQIDPATAQEDYIIKRRDGLFAYQLVVVLDDVDQQITEVVRGADLLTMTPRQQALFQLYTPQVPKYAHLPLAVSAPGQKLSKQNHATDIRAWPLAVSLVAALRLLGHPPPAELVQAPCEVLLQWARQHWQLSAVPAVMEVQVDAFR